MCEKTQNYSICKKKSAALILLMVAGLLMEILHTLEHISHQHASASHQVERLGTSDPQPHLNNSHQDCLACQLVSVQRLAAQQPQPSLTIDFNLDSFNGPSTLLIAQKQVLWRLAPKNSPPFSLSA